MRVKTIAKRLVAATLATITTVFSITPCIAEAAAPGYASRSSAMIQFFASEDITGQITAEDLKLFGIYMSNFYEPFETDNTNILQVMKTACEKLMGGSIPTEGATSVETLIGAVHGNIQNYSSPIVGANGTEVSLSDILNTGGTFYIPYRYKISTTSAEESSDAQTVATEEVNTDVTDEVASDLGEEGGSEPTAQAVSTQLVKEEGLFPCWTHVVGSEALLDSDDVEGAGSYCNFALMLSIFCNTDNAVDFLSTGRIDDTLMLSPFGDILTSSGCIVIPGCLNPYTWSSDGLCLPLINDIAMPLIKDNLSKSGGTWYLKIQEDKLDSANQGIAIYGLQTKDTWVGGKVTTAPVVEAHWNNILVAINQTAFGSEKLVPWGSGTQQDLYKIAFNKGGTSKNDLRPGAKLLIADKAFTKAENIQQGLYLFDMEKKYDSSSEVMYLFFDKQGTVPSNQLKKYSSSESFISAAKPILFEIPGWGNDVSYYPFNMGVTGIWNIEEQLNWKHCTDYDVISTPSKVATSLQVSNNNFYPQIFYTYMMSGLNANLSDVDVTAVSMLASMSDVLNNSDLEEMQKKLLQRMLDLTADGTSEKKGSFFTDAINSFILKQHRTALGIKSSNIATVSNSGMAYSGFTGHVTTPTLRDLPFTSSIMEKYNQIYLVLMSIVIVCLVMMFICHMRTWQQCVSVFLIMAVCLALPEGLIDGVITLSNTASNSMYANRFNYWAMIQHQQELQDVRDAKQSSDLTQRLVENLNMVKNYYSDDGVQLKWMAAKKEDPFESVFGDSLEEDGALIPGASVFKFLFSGYFKQESYSSDALATYVYRTYSSIASAAKAGCILLQGAASDATEVPDELLITVPELQAVKNGVYSSDIKDMYAASFNSVNYRTAHLDWTKVSQRDVTPQSVVGFDVQEGVENDATTYTFLLYSESPFYFFYNALANTNAGGNTVTVSEDEVSGFLPVLLSEDLYTVSDTESPFYGLEKDFLDLEGLFTYVIPYMYSANDIVIRFTELRGTDYDKYNDGTDTGKSLSLNSKDDIRKVWNLYCPWVDALYSTGWVSDRIAVAGKKTYVDGFNPSTYYKNEGSESTGRPMVFGEADMVAKGVSLGDLTKVERKIYNVIHDTYVDMRYLANYANFSDEVLLTAAAMSATFNFNQEFTQSGLFKESIIQYPQGYELKTFSYDAFLRLILLNSTGQSVMAKTDIYTAVIENSSIWTGLLLLLVDALALYVVPAAKLIFIIAVFVLSLLMMLTCFLQGVESVPKTVVNVILVPMLKFLFTAIGHAFFTALLMGEGLTEYVGSKSGSIITNDPSITLLLLCLINGVASVFFIKTLIGIIKEGISWAKATFDAVRGLIKNFGNTVANGVKKMSVATADSVVINGNANGWGNSGESTASTSSGGSSGGAKQHRLGFRTHKNTGSLPKSYQRKMLKTLKNIDNNMVVDSTITEAGETGGSGTPKPNKGMTKLEATEKIANATVKSTVGTQKVTNADGTEVKAVTAEVTNNYKASDAVKFDVNAGLEANKEAAKTQLKNNTAAEESALRLKAREETTIENRNYDKQVAQIEEKKKNGTFKNDAEYEAAKKSVAEKHVESLKEINDRFQTNMSSTKDAFKEAAKKLDSISENSDMLTAMNDLGSKWKKAEKAVVDQVQKMSSIATADTDAMALNDALSGLKTSGLDAVTSQRTLGIKATTQGKLDSIKQQHTSGSIKDAINPVAGVKKGVSTALDSQRIQLERNEKAKLDEIKREAEAAKKQIEANRMSFNDDIASAAKQAQELGVELKMRSTLQTK